MLEVAANLRKSTDPAAELALYDVIVERYGTATEPEVRAVVAGALASQGILFRRSGDPTRAVAAYDESLRRDARQPIVLFNRAIALRELGRLEEALGSAEEASRLDTSLSDAYYNRACLLSLLGKPDLAYKVLEHAIALDPRWGPEARADPDLRALREDPGHAEAFLALVKGE